MSEPTPTNGQPDYEHGRAYMTTRLRARERIFGAGPAIHLARRMLNAGPPKNTREEGFDDACRDYLAEKGEVAP